MCKKKSITISSEKFLSTLILILLLLLISACNTRNDNTPTPTPQSSSPHSQIPGHSSPSPEPSNTLSPVGRKTPPHRYGEDLSIREAKRKYIPREVWDVAGSPDLAKERIYLNKAIQKDPTNPEPLYFLGFNYFEARMLKESADAFEKVLKLKSDHVLSLENLTLVYFQDHQYNKAESTAEKGLKLYPDNPRLIYILGQCFLAGEKDPEKAVQFYTSALKRGIKSPYIYTGLAEVYIEKGGETKKGAFGLLEKCISEYPEYPNAPPLLAELYMERGDAEKAISLLKKVIDTTPSFTDAQRLLGEIYIETADYKLAEEILQRALNHRPDNINEIRNLLGEVYINVGNIEKARDILEQVVNCKGEDPDHSENLASAYLKLALADILEKKIDSAQDHIKKAEKEKPDPGLLNFVKSRLYMEEGDFDKAEELLNNILEEDKEEASLSPYRVYIEIARVKAASGDLKKAREFLEKAKEKAAGYQKITLKTLISQDDRLKRLK